MLKEADTDFACVITYHPTWVAAGNLPTYTYHNLTREAAEKMAQAYHAMGQDARVVHENTEPAT